MEEGDGSRPNCPLAVVEDWRRRLVDGPALGGIGVGALTGHMSGENEAAAIADFASGNTPILVSTTVTEVGVGVPKTPMMVILDARHFGLPQLHQLHGQVGRGSRSPPCVMVTGVEIGPAAFY